MKIHTIGGYEKVGANMTAIEVDNQIVILDMGADIERLVEQGENIEEMKTVETIEANIVPDDSEIKERREDVVGIIIGHGHQDHCRGLPKLAGAYNCPIITTPYTANILERFIENDRENVNNEIVRMDPGETTQISDNFELEFVDITHSIPQAVLSLLKTPDGNVLYSLDFKLDEQPTLGNPVDYNKLEKIGKEGIETYIVDCTRADEPGKTRSERKTKLELRNLLNQAYQENRGTIVTTFSSHIARLNNILAANDNRRKVVLLGRSLKEYTRDAQKLDLIDLSNVRVASYRDEVENVLREISNQKHDYLLVTTGNQGEPNAMLSRIAANDYPYTVSKEDFVIFSSVTIPTSINEMNREYLKRTLKQKGAHVEVDIHSHGHAMRKDHRKMMEMIDPNTVIPAHGGKEKLSACANLAREVGVDSVQIASNGGLINVS